MMKLKVKEPIAGFTERDVHSKAVLNTDVSGLLKYKLQKKKFSDINKTSSDINEVKQEVDIIKNELSEIKDLLKQITLR